MYRLTLIVAAALLFASCNTIKISGTEVENMVFNSIDLVNVVDDRIKVEVSAPTMTGSETIFHLPAIVPGTYAMSNFGQFISDLQAMDKKDRSLKVEQLDQNSWKIEKANKLDKISYWVDDTFDSEKDHGIYVMGGTNIEVGKNFLLNLYGFIGYFNGMKNTPYTISVKHPANLYESTSLKAINNTDNTTDTFRAARYEEVADNPLMYSESNNATFNVSGIDVNLVIYSPNNIHKASDLKDDLEKMMLAQTKFLEGFKTTDEYNILVYLFDSEIYPWASFGALEHTSSTTVVFPETFTKEMLAESMINNVVSHEFFHIVTPLAIHSEEIHDFNFNNPDMSAHLWMYEGTTEYFAKLFQVQQGLIDANAFLEQMINKVGNASVYADDMSFTEMSENILKEPYKSNYANVYQKGALISMCLDLIMREKSNGSKGWRDVMLGLAQRYGKNKPFKDETIISEITEMTYPEIGVFLQKHVVGGTPIDYTSFLNKTGAQESEKMVTGSYLIDAKNTPFLDGNLNGLYFSRTNAALEHIGIQVGDILKSVDDITLDLTRQESIQNAIMKSFSWKEGDDITIGIERDGKPMEMKGKAVKPQYLGKTTTFLTLPDDDPKKKLRNSWLGI